MMTTSHTDAAAMATGQVPRAAERSSARRTRRVNATERSKKKIAEKSVNISKQIDNTYLSIFNCAKILVRESAPKVGARALNGF